MSTIILKREGNADDFNERLALAWQEALDSVPEALIAVTNRARSGDVEALRFLFDLCDVWKFLREEGETDA